jgi:hypothetical protein
MIAELTVMIQKLKIMRDQNERLSLFGIVGYLNGAIDDLEDCVRLYQKHHSQKREG